MDLTLTGLTVTRRAQTVLDNITLQLVSGQTIGLVGPNGSGKSTLLRCLAGLMPDQAHHVALNGIPLAHLSLKRRARALAFVPQHAEVDGALCVEQIVRLGRTPWRGLFQGRGPEDDEAVDEAIRQMRLCRLRKRGWRQLSGGERQRCQIARALAQRPQVLLLDEPTNHLDIQHQLELMRLTSQLPQTVVVALHDLNLAANFCQTLVLLTSGRVAAAGTPETVLTPERIKAAWNVKAEVAREANRFLIGYRMG